MMLINNLDMRKIKENSLLVVVVLSAVGTKPTSLKHRNAQTMAVP